MRSFDRQSTNKRAAKVHDTHGMHFGFNSAALCSKFAQDAAQALTSLTANNLARRVSPWAHIAVSGGRYEVRESAPGGRETE
jgi:hypothetical protein